MKRPTALLVSLIIAICPLFYRAGSGEPPAADGISGAWLKTWLKENAQSVTLELYYRSPYVFTYAPLTVPDLMKSHDVYISVDGASVEEHIDLLCQMLDTPAVPVDGPDEVHLDARVYYALRGKDGVTLFNVAMWGMAKNDSIFINGIPCTAEPIFYDVAMEFLPADAAAELASYLGGASEQQEIIPFEDVRLMFDTHKEDLDLLYRTFEENYACINIGLDADAERYRVGLMPLDASYVSLEHVEPERMREYIEGPEAADAAVRVLSEMDGMNISYVQADEAAGREATFGVTLYPGVVSIERGTTVSGYEDLWQELGDGWFYAVWRSPDG